ncbi:cephalosporin-C deacetylase [Agreia bicolorata]|uniref:Cephalosporin-C deacetylase n=1 Tax=Agreia bicolorata TaxID=110935 RepID=A0A1T4WQP6_9MICO|nr:acetylxylan esterase [Agreia bicolorata]SKA79188.1 cephalosporin-C deacetylase [Agreia bicolorata]
MLIESDLDAVRRHTIASEEPVDFDDFWQATLAEAQNVDLDVRVQRVESVLSLIDVYDVTFRGAGGTDVKAWLRVPAGATAPLPTVVTYVGYGGGRGKPEESLTWVAAGLAHLHMDTRGQGASWSVGDTPDVSTGGPQIPGVMTRGIQNRDDFYYRRLITDAVRAVDAAKQLPQVDATRIAVAGGSQGGGLALAVAGLRDDLAAAVAFVPFLCDFGRATLITDSYPYREIVDYLRIHRDQAASVYDVLGSFDAVFHARRATAPVHFSVALMDATCPASTVYAAFNAYAGPKEITEWAFNGHEGGGIEDETQAIAFVKKHLGV